MKIIMIKDHDDDDDCDAVILHLQLIHCAMN